jgi:hypothetical protein
VRPTLEVVLTESPKYLHKRKDPERGLALMCLRNESKPKTRQLLLVTIPRAGNSSVVRRLRLCPRHSDEAASR